MVDLDASVTAAKAAVMLSRGYEEGTKLRLVCDGRQLPDDKTLTEAGITATSNIVLVKSRFQPQTKVERWLETFKKDYINMWLNELTHESTSFNITLAVFSPTIESFKLQSVHKLVSIVNTIYERAVVDEQATHEIAMTPPDWEIGKKWLGAYEKCIVLNETDTTCDVEILSDYNIRQDILKLYVRRIGGPNKYNSVALYAKVCLALHNQSKTLQSQFLHFFKHMNGWCWVAKDGLDLLKVSYTLSPNGIHTINQSTCVSEIISEPITLQIYSIKTLPGTPERNEVELSDGNFITSVMLAPQLSARVRSGEIKKHTVVCILPTDIGVSVGDRSGIPTTIIIVKCTILGQVPKLIGNPKIYDPRVWSTMRSYTTTHTYVVPSEIALDKVGICVGGGPYTTEKACHKGAFKHTKFRTLLINRCQNQFRRLTIEEELVETSTSQNAFGRRRLNSTMTDYLEKNKTVDQYGKAKLSLQIRFSSYYIFIGHLYEHGVVPEAFLVDKCIHPLLSGNGDDLDSDCLVLLMTTIGQKFESTQKYKQLKVKIYASIFTLSINNATIDNWTPDTELSKSRIPALEYLSLLRKNSWQPLHASIQAEYLTKSFECLFEKSHNGPSDNGNKIIDQETQHRLDMIVSEQ